MAELNEIVNWLDCELQPENFKDAPGAQNGLQLENVGTVTKAVAAVDACEATISEAIACGADLMIVHHGLFWMPISPVTGRNYRKLKLAMDAGLAVYSMHLPLDAHPTLGNNALLAKAMGFEETQSFLEMDGNSIGVKVECDLPRKEVIERLRVAVNGPVHVCEGGREQVRHLGICSGGAGGEVQKAMEEGVDTFISGEAPHWSYTLAEELRMNLLLGGHYATETFGVKALAEKVSERFDIPWEFLDHPSGL